MFAALDAGDLRQLRRGRRRRAMLVDGGHGVFNKLLARHMRGNVGYMQICIQQKDGVDYLVDHICPNMISVVRAYQQHVAHLKREGHNQNCPPSTCD